ncbi:MAG: hypothetical protein EB089_08390 [Acidimicrobiia bacterium]|nr:hypothetical protein [Acidimicrobiia bacterium]
MPKRDLSLGWGLLEQMGVRRDDRYGPVMIGRELLIRSFAIKDRPNGARNAATLVNAAATTFMWGVLDPSSTEYPIDGIEFGKADAMMWFGISAAIMVPHNGVLDSDDIPSRPDSLRSSADPEALEVASRRFEQLGDLTKAGRCAEEYAEVLKCDGESASSGRQFDRAAALFTRGNESARSSAAKQRASATDHPDSPFFRVPAGPKQSTTICGSRQFLELRKKLRLG